jgi:hypothetical protein
MMFYSLSLKSQDHTHRHEMDDIYPTAHKLEKYLSKIPFSQWIQLNRTNKTEKTGTVFPALGTKNVDTL